MTFEGGAHIVITSCKTCGLVLSREDKGRSESSGNAELEGHPQ